MGVPSFDLGGFGWQATGVYISCAVKVDFRAAALIGITGREFCDTRSGNWNLFDGGRIRATELEAGHTQLRTG